MKQDRGYIILVVGLFLLLVVGLMLQPEKISWNATYTKTEKSPFASRAVYELLPDLFPGQPIDVVGHSFGGCAAGLAASAPLIRRLVTVGAQFAYWRDYAADSRWQLLCKWHLAMPLLTRVFGYFPGKRLGWMEDTPAGVVHDWTTRTPRYEHRPSGRLLERVPFAHVQAATLAISLTDDPFGTVAATERLLGYLQGAERQHLRIAPVDISVEKIGHFAFFHDRFRGSLWPIALAWLQQGGLPEEVPGTVIK